MRCINIYILLLFVFIGGVANGAVKKKAPSADEVLEQARAAFHAYNPEEARDLYDEYVALLKKKKTAVPDDVQQEIDRLVMMENMLSRVERITIVDSLVVDVDKFFQHYRLSPESGRFVGGDAVRMPDVEMVFVPQNNTEILYARPDTAGVYELMGADILDDGTLDRPSPLEGDNLAGGGNAEYPFLMADGMTLYFANDGEGSLGGYDIFLTRRDDDGTFLQPQNIGMPYNSPYDDYLLAIDEITGAGWWATDRNQILGKLTIYIFEPSETRVNVDADDLNLVSLALLDDIGLTQQNSNVEAVKARIEAISSNQGANTSGNSSFDLPVGNNNRIYHSLSDFKSPLARQAMAQAIDARTEVRRIEVRLQALREQWAAGNHSQGITILNLEQQLDDARKRQAESTNRAIEEEIRQLGE